MAYRRLLMPHLAVQFRAFAEATLFWTLGVPAIAVAALVLQELLRLEELKHRPLMRTAHDLPSVSFSDGLEAA